MNDGGGGGDSRGGGGRVRFWGMASWNWIGKEAVVGHHREVPWHLRRGEAGLRVGAGGGVGVGGRGICWWREGGGAGGTDEGEGVGAGGGVRCVGIGDRHHAAVSATRRSMAYAWCWRETGGRRRAW